MKHRLRGLFADINHQHSTTMKVKDVMSKQLVVGYLPGTIKDALKILAKHNVSGMPILKKHTKKYNSFLMSKYLCTKNKNIFIEFLCKIHS